MARETTVERFMLRDRELLLARADFAPLFQDHLEHARRWVGEPTGLSLKLMQQGLAAAGLYITFRALDENTAWTLNLSEPPLNIFITADCRTGRVVGRHFEENVATVDHSRLFVQSVRNIGKPQLSGIEVTGFDMLAIFEQYYDQSEQQPARFFQCEASTYLMLAALPDIDAAWLEGLSLVDARALLEAPGLQRIEERTVFFGCPCDQARVHEVVRSVFKGKEDELFAGDEQVEVRCPRCGEAYQITREQFAADREAGESADPGAGSSPDPAGGPPDA